MTDGDGEPAAMSPGRRETGRVGLSAFLRLIWHNSVAALLLALAFGAVILVVARQPRPIIQYEARTDIVRMTVAGDLETVWNLPGKSVSVQSIVDDEPVRREEALGVGALVLPEGTRLKVTRHAGRPLYLEVEGHADGAPPRAISEQYPEGFALPAGSIVAVSGRADEACAHKMPALSLRGVGEITLGASLNKGAADDPADLKGLDDEAFLARNAQPLLNSGRVFVRGQPVIPTFGRTYEANELTLHAGDVLRVPEGSTGTGAVFVLQVADCAPLEVRGSLKSDNVEVLRLGSDTSLARVTFWQAVTKDPFLTLLIGALGVFLATYWSFVNERAEKD